MKLNKKKNQDKSEIIDIKDMSKVVKMENKKIRLIKYDKGVGIKNFLHSSDLSYQVNVILPSSHFTLGRS